jgi:two-component system, OmpR family, sensor histidine kinase KdpD
MLDRRKERGTYVVIGFIETHHRPHTAELAAQLEVVPRQQVPYKGVTVEELDTDAVILCHPAVALVDELAHTNAPGSTHEKRWQDVEDLLQAGITVISTVNIQHLESLADIVEHITGVTVRERIPDRVVGQADEVELIDMSPHALRQRMRHGNVRVRAGARRVHAATGYRCGVVGG